MKRFALLSVLATTALFGAVEVGAQARGQLVFTPYNASAVQQAVRTDQRVLLVFTKNGCPVCTRQIASLQPLLSTPEFRGLKVWQVDVIKQPELAKRYRVTQQSTLVVLDDGREVTRRQGITQAAQIAALLRTPA